VLGISERTLRRRVADGKIEAAKNTSPETGAAWFIERATVEALKAPSPNSTELKGSVPVEEEKEIQALAQVAPEQSTEIVRLRDDVQQIKAFLLGQALAEEGEDLPTNLGTVIGQAMRETLAPLVERIEQQSAENALLKQQLAQAQTREQQSAYRRSWWPFSKRHK